MSVTSILSNNGNKITISISGQLDANLYDDFTSAFADMPGNNITYEVDMSKVTYMDSSGLGMLMVLKEHAGGSQKNVTISNPSAKVKDVLIISCFDKIFEII